MQRFVPTLPYDFFLMFFKGDIYLFKLATPEGPFCGWEQDPILLFDMIP